MKTSTKGRYALRMMIDIALHEEGGTVALREVAEREELSSKYLERLAKLMVDAELLIGERGNKGGYRLARTAESISVGDILRAAEGGTAPVACLEAGAETCPHRPDCSTIDFWEGLYHVLDEYADGYSLDRLAHRP
jgi:Rrf2 family protein